jgi:cell division protein FtsW (lipid II flippase)
LKSQRRQREVRLLALVIIILLSGSLLFYLTKPFDYGILIIYAALFLAILFLAVHLLIRWKMPQADEFLFPGIGLLTVLGLLFIYQSDPALAARQCLWTVLGLVLFSLIILFWRDYRFLADYKYTFMLVGLGFLLLTVLAGTEAGGARSWLSLGSFRFQPAEPVKLLLIIFVAAYLAENSPFLSEEDGSRPIFWLDLGRYGPVLLFWCMTLLLLVVQKDLGAALIFFGVFLALVYVATGRLAHLIFGGMIFVLASLAAYSYFPHIRARVAIWINPWPYADAAGYQLIQSLFLLAQGGLFGAGIGMSRPFYLPAAATDFVFSVACGELGFLGGAFILTVYMLLGYRSLTFCLEAHDEFGLLLGAGLSLLFSIQSLVIIGGILRLLPLTGVTLPFMSYGGSSLLINHIMFGLLLSLSFQFRSARGENRDEV